MNHRTAVRALAMAITGVALLAVTSVTRAHPTGKSAICRYSRLTVEPDLFRVRYVLDMAEIPTAGEKQVMDKDKNGVISDTEKKAYLETKVPELVAALSLTVDDQKLALRTDSASASLSGGAAGLETLRLVVDLSAPLSAKPAEVRVAYRDRNYETRAGWKEVVACAGPGIALRDSTVPAKDQSAELTKYPKFTAPLAVTEARFAFAPEMNASESPARRN